MSEELISDFFKISTSEWKRYRYDFQSLKDLSEGEVTDHAFAQIRRYRRSPHQRLRGSEPGDYFKICLQDHVIRQAICRDPHIRLFPLTAYIAAHELIHVVRFSRFLQSFDSFPWERRAEEKRVHALTEQLLHNCRIQGLEEVLEAFRECYAMETFQKAVEQVLEPRGKPDVAMKEKISREEVRHVADLARLELSEQEELRMTEQMNRILGYMDQLNELNTEEIPPTTHAIQLQNVFREDEVQDSLPGQQALANAPKPMG